MIKNIYHEKLCWLKCVYCWYIPALHQHFCINISALANQQWNCSLVYLLNLPWPSYWLSSETSLLFNNNKTIQLNNISSALSTLANLYDLTITCWRPPPPSNTNYNKTSKKFILSESEYFQSYFDLLFKVRWK